MSVWFSYHGGHSGQFCRHAKGELEPVVQRAVEAGFTHYGLSEHCPRDRTEELYPEESDLGPSGLARLFAEYTARALELRDAYRDRIELLVGFETERLPPGSWATRMRELRKAAPFDYVVGSVHDIDGRFLDYKPELTRELADELGGPDALHAHYFDLVTELVETLRPEVVGHLDLVRKFDGPSARFSANVWPHIERALEAVRACGGVLDVNCGAYRRKLSPVYPLPEILSRARELDIRVTLGDDGHGAHDVGVGLEACVQAIAAAGYRELHYLARQEGAVVWRSAPLDEVRPRVR